MPVLTGFISKIKTLYSAIKNLFKRPAKNHPKSNHNIVNRISSFIRDKLSGTKGRLIFICFAAVLVILMLIGLFSMIRKPENRERSIPVQAYSERIIIPPEELFFPEEPDFIPGVMLERERRTVWTADDAALYWQDPLKDGEEPWREQIEKAIDEIMERVP